MRWAVWVNALNRLSERMASQTRAFPAFKGRLGRSVTVCGLGFSVLGRCSTFISPTTISMGDDGM